MNERLTWDEYGLAIATVVSQRAACTRRQVGAVIVDKNHHVVSTGYNGTAKGRLNCTEGGCPRGKLSYDERPAFGGYDESLCVHAEQNALLRAGERARNATLYCTCQPCPVCRILIEAAGLAKVVWPEGEINYE